MELEGDLVLERPPTRRWVSIIAVVIPVVAVVSVAAWFIRAYVAPPTVAVPNPMQLASAPATFKPGKIEAPAPAAVPEPQVPAAAPEPPMAPPPSADAPAAAAPASSLPMFATLSAAPPTLTGAPTAFADPAQEPSPATATATMDTLENAEPIAGPVPLPRMKPHLSLALVTGPVPLPRPKPETDTPAATDLPAFDRHAIE